ncbi:hypothetical protein MC378_03615 [Polaribacter sp. MSW13]|uniref:NHL repeat-containing protein n=1 Tax=Polaribacter marinus TaxID=2916838 RepID=A0A9X1VLA3_9FLAO|nr:hypothetical protein [Polaribacter marinus]MCI2228242.1 hypothetical protein [Polaribacter marinus]
MNYNTLGTKINNAYTFKGAEEKPFLAPRGVFVANDMLFVSDTGQNRVFVWNTIPTSEFQNPDVILGQMEVSTIGRNSGGIASASTLQYPSGIWSDGKILVVADAWNHRVLIWLKMPTKNGQLADVVLGQPDFNANKPNVKGIGNDPTSQSLNWPYGVFSDGTQLWIADTGNRRILYYKSIPTTNYEKADAVIGKPDFTTRDYENNDVIWPYSIKINSKGQMAVADTQFYRVLVWNDWKFAFKNKADIIIGQDNFDACGQNQFRLSPEANTLNWTYDACFYKNGILVNDTGNSRILGFDTIPKKNNTPADWLIGRPNFKTSSEYKENMHGTQKAIYWPFSITTYKNKLFLADTGNHRLVIGDL